MSVPSATLTVFGAAGSAVSPNDMDVAAPSVPKTVVSGPTPSPPTGEPILMSVMSSIVIVSAITPNPMVSVF